MFIFHDLFKHNRRNKKIKSIAFRLAKDNMSSKIVGWLVGARDGKILELRIQSGINKISGSSWFLQNSGISFLVMANTKVLPFMYKVVYVKLKRKSVTV